MADSYEMIVLGGGHGGLLVCAAGRGPRPEGRAGREGEGRRHLPALGLHPDQGTAAGRRGRRARADRRRVRRQRHLRRRRHGTRPVVQAEDRRHQLEGPAGLAEEARRRRRSRARATSRTPRPSWCSTDDGERTLTRRKAMVLATGSKPQGPADRRRRDRRRDGHHLRPRAVPRPRPAAPDRHRRQRGRHGVRLDLARLRRRGGHGHRGAAQRGARSRTSTRRRRWPRTSRSPG